MFRRPVSKLLTLERRHPGLQQKIDAMLDEFWTIRQVRQMLSAQYGEQISTSCLEKYKARHRAEQRRLVEEMAGLIEAVADREIGPSSHQHAASSELGAMETLAAGPFDELVTIKPQVKGQTSKGESDAWQINKIISQSLALPIYRPDDEPIAQGEV
jgi:hypothetical protein